MALNTITPSNREEEYLSAIAGDEGASAPTPSNRREEWLRRIAKGQGDQTDRLDHIEDQIPVDPAAADVGKVMTVIADESGETPVYKWSAEPVNTGEPLYLSTGMGPLSKSLTWSNVSEQNFSGTAAFKAAARAVRDQGNVNLFRDWLAAHVNIDINGCKAVYRGSSINSGVDSTSINVDVPAILPVSGTDRFLWVRYTFSFDMKESTTTLLTLATPTFWTYGSNAIDGEISGSTVTKKDYPLAVVTCKLS